MMLPIISIEIDGKIVASFDIGGYTTISGKTLYIYLRSIYKPIARNPEIIELCGNQVNLKVLGIEIPARELVKHWSSLEDYRGFKFMMIFCEWLMEGVRPTTYLLIHIRKPRKSGNCLIRAR